MRYHAGEIAVQEQAGARRTAERVAAGVHARLPEVAVAFLAEQRLAAAASCGADGSVWCSLVAGPPGFLSAGPEGIVAACDPPEGDPLRAHLVEEGPLGLVVLDPDGRRRLRANGRGRLSGGTLRLRVEEAYANCPKYIQRRVPAADAPHPPAPARTAAALEPAQRVWIARSDTFFIATCAGPGADASHRGGTAGFIEVASPRLLRWGDYSGNAMFNTLGNLALHPAAGLLFLDFERGHTLQLSGAARIDWDAGRAQRFPGAQRLVEFEITAVREVRHATPLRFQLLEPSPFNPAPP